MKAELALDEDQQLVAYAAATERLLVVAGPGSGKTETVSARIEHLVEDEGLYPGNVLVISFSRAAVEAVQRRQRSRGTHATGWVTTLDSLATRLLAEAEVDPTGLTFDRRIDRVLRLSREKTLVHPLRDVSHVIVDEAQDIVGQRAELVVALLKGLEPEVGFTILGDPLQGIYDFQLSEGEEVGQNLADAVVEMGATKVRLAGQYRAASRDAAKAMALRDTVGGPDLWRSSMLAWLADVPLLADRDDFTRMVSQQTGSVAVLTETNASALVALQSLLDEGISAELLPRSTDRALGPWIATLLGDLTHSLTRDEFLERAAAELPLDPEEAWVLMRRLTPARSKYLDAREVASRLATGMAPIALGTPRRKVVVSTVHRAKGLEFDNVFLLHPDDWRQEDPWALARATYVAITRPRKSLYTFRSSGHMKRWFTDKKARRVVRAKGYGTTGFEICGIDWRGPHPPNHDDDPVAAQKILHNVTSDDPRPVTIELDEYRSTPSCPVYEASLEGTPIGTLNEEFVHSLRARIKVREGNWPELIGVNLVGVETVAGTPQQGPVGTNGLWLSPQIVGPATLIWSRE